LSPHRDQPPYLCGFLPFFRLGKIFYTIPRYDHVKVHSDDRVICIIAEGMPVGSVANKFHRFYRSKWPPYYLKKLEGGRFYRTILVLPREPIIIFADIYDVRNLDNDLSSKIHNNFFFRSLSNNVKSINNKLCITNDNISTWFENIFPSNEIRNLNIVRIGTSKGFAHILDDNNLVREEAGFITNIKAIYFDDNGSIIPEFHLDILSLQLIIKIKTNLDDYNIQMDVEKKAVKKIEHD
jgi:hypothetical protein